eukprot:3117040-Ditylum_brightwellii.AAC.2
MNIEYCILLHLCIFLETWIKEGVGITSQWLFVDGITAATAPQREQIKEADNLKSAYTRAIKFATDNPLFIQSTRAELLGSHSIWELATTVCH